MKKLRISFALLILILPIRSWAAPAIDTPNMTWEIQYGSTANNVNGCGFDPVSGTPGTNWSIYPTCRYSWVHGAGGVCNQTVKYNLEDDLTCTNAAASVCTSAALASAVTGNGTGFLASDVGNTIYFISGTKLFAAAGSAAGRAVIVSVTGGAATLDKNVSDTTGDATELTATLGGACSMNSTADDDFFEILHEGNDVYVLYNASAIALGESVAITTGMGTAALPIWVVGYKAAGERNRTSTLALADMPTMNTAAFSLTWGAYYVVRNLSVTGTSATTMSSGSQTILYNVKAQNTSATADRIAFSLGTNARAIRCEMISDAGVALQTGASARTYGSYIHDSKTCVNVNAVGGGFYFNIIDTCSLIGVNFAATYDNIVLIGNTIYGAATPPGTGTVGIGGAAADSENDTVIGNIIFGWDTGISYTANALSNYFNWNNLYNNTTPRAYATAGPNDIALDPAFVDAPNGNFAVGANMKAAGFPGLLPGSGSTGYLDIGAIQRIEPAAGGGTTGYAH